MPNRRELLVGGLWATSLSVASPRPSAFYFESASSEWSVHRPDSQPGDQLTDDPQLLAVSRTIAQVESAGSVALRDLVEVLEAQHGPTTYSVDDPIYVWILDPETGQWLHICKEATTLTVELPDESRVEVIRHDRVPLS